MSLSGAPEAPAGGNPMMSDISETLCGSGLKASNLVFGLRRDRVGTSVVIKVTN
ncbi:hypothetical protein AB0F81_20245 [Actinoplanes sp. NPDC024001]|uniref:hypothetical protein n=1 Tax=Actinoplanes sp. NPDC024001 TaxID=3154598 RepID=UPI0033EBC91B